MPHTYQLAPNFDIPPPPKCPLKLGQILTNLKDPLYCLNANKVVEPLDSPVIESLPAKGLSATRAQLKEHGFKVWAKLADLFPIGASGEHGHQASWEDAFTIERVETTFFLPTTSYVADSLNCDGVKSYLEGARWKKPLFMITGIKVAVNATVESYKAGTRNTHVEASAAVSPAGPSIAAGAATGSKTENSESTSFSSDGFLLGFEVRQIVCSKNKPPKTKPYNEGAFFEAGGSKSQGYGFHFMMDEDEPHDDNSGYLFGPLGLWNQDTQNPTEERFFIS